LGQTSYVFTMQLQLFDDSTLYVEYIQHNVAKPFVYQHHYLRGIGNNGMCFGAYVGNQLMAVVVFTVPCSEAVRASILGPQYKQNITELGRLCLHPTCTVPASKIVSMAIKALQRVRAQRGLPPILALLSFADNTQNHHGGVYQAMSWLYCGTSRRNAIAYIDQNGITRHPRQNGVNITPQMAVQRGWRICKQQCTKYRYIRLLGSKTQRNRARAQLLLPVLPYPKPNAG
jgi:hypothetical protein